MRKQKSGFILCKIKAITPLWIDCVCAKTGRQVTFLTKFPPPRFFSSYIGTKGVISIKGQVTDDPDIYLYQKASKYRQYQVNSITRRHIAERELEENLNEGCNPARGCGRNKQAHAAPTRKEGKSKLVTAIRSAMELDPAGNPIEAELKRMGL